MNNFDFKSFCSAGFLAEYFDFAEPLTDAPEQFHIATSLSVLSTVIGNNIFLQLGDKKLFSNIWALVLAPSSSHRKSSSLQIGLNLIREVNKELILPNEFSLEAFLEHLSKYPQGILSYSEFSSLLEMCQRSYMVGLKSTLTDLYDCRPWFTRELKSGTYTIENGCLTVTAASTISWLIEHLRESDIRGGFMSRFLFFVASKKTKSLPIPPKADVAKRQRLIDELKKLSEFKGEMEISPEAKVRYEQWYQACEKKSEWELQKELLSGFFHRLPDYCWKLAMLYSASVEKSLIISEQAICKAMTLTDYIRENTIQAVDQDFEFTKEGKNKKKIYAMIERHFSTRKTAIDHSTLLRNSHVPAKELKEALDVLCAEGKLLPATGDGRYWPSV